MTTMVTSTPPLAGDLIRLGVVRLAVEAAYLRYETWLEQGWHAGMSYLEKHLAVRRNPEQLLPGAKVALVYGLPYAQGDRWPAGTPGPRVAQYARFPDYHHSLRAALETVARSLGLAPERYRVTVDSVPLLERELAAQTAEGFVGKNTCYIHPRWGSFLLLGEILSTEEWPVDAKTAIDPNAHRPEGGCGTCDRCQVNCPTGALDEAYRLDSRKCLAYWTIEHRGTIPFALWKWFGLYWFGCDICQLVCPYNRKQALPPLPAALPVRALPSLSQTALMTQAEYERWFGGTPLTRAKRAGLRRNALIALVATGDKELATVCAELQREDFTPEMSVVRDTLAQIPHYPG